MKLRTLIKRSSRVIDIRCRDSGVGGRAGECVGEGVEGVDVDVVVYVGVCVRVGGRCVVISFVRPPSVPRILSRSSYSLLRPTFFVVHVPSWRPVSCALEIAVHPVHSSYLEPGRSSSKSPLLWETFFLFSFFFLSPTWAGWTN